MYCARSRASVRSSYASVGPYPVKLQEAATQRRLIAILVTHDFIDWLGLCMCPLTVTFKYSRTKYSRMAADPRKPQTLNPAKIKAHTVCTSMLYVHCIPAYCVYGTSMCTVFYVCTSTLYCMCSIYQCTVSFLRPFSQCSRAHRREWPSKTWCVGLCC